MKRTKTTNFLLKNSIEKGKIIKANIMIHNTKQKGQK